MTKLRGWISDVVWDEESTAASTQGILVAMHAGKIYHVVVEAGTERSARVMHQLDERLLALKAVGPTVFAATPSRLYTFAGPADHLQSQGLLYEVPVEKAAVTRSELHAHRNAERTLVVWMSGAGALVMMMDASGPGKANIIPYSLSTETVDFLPQMPQMAISMVVTDFHLIFLFEDKVQLVSQITQRPVATVALSPSIYSTPKALLQDSSDGRIWFHSDRYLYDLKVHNEATAVWWLYATTGQTSKALAQTRTRGQARLVQASRAFSLFQDEEYKEAAKVFAEGELTGPLLSFEDICLRFLPAGEETALLEFLNLKKIQAKHEAGGPGEVQSVLLSTWMLELLLHELARCEQAGGKVEEHTTKIRAFLAATAPSTRSGAPGRQDFDGMSFVVYELLRSSARMDLLLYYAELVKDYDFVIRQLVQDLRFDEAIEKLAQFDPSQARDSIVVKFAATLFQASPGAFVSLVTSPTFLTIKPLKLLPAMLSAETCSPTAASTSRHAKEAVRFLEFVRTRGAQDMDAARRPWTPTSTFSNVLTAAYAHYPDMDFASSSPLTTRTRASMPLTRCDSARSRSLGSCHACTFTGCFRCTRKQWTLLWTWRT
jgi:hypothetical protein